MDQIITGVSAQKSPFHSRADAATVADVMRPPVTTVTQYDHVAAAAYLMKHAGTTALMVVDAQTGHPAGIITEADIAHAIADGKDVNDVRVHAVMTTRPAITTTIRGPLEQVDTKRGVTFGGEPAADVSDVVAQPGGLVDDHHAGKRPGAIWESQLRPAQQFGPHDLSLPCWRPICRATGTHINTPVLNDDCESSKRKARPVLTN